MSGWSPHGIRSLELHLTERDVSVLEDLERFRLLTTRHVQRLHFGVAPYGHHVTLGAGTRATTRVLLRLQERGVITRLTRRIGGLQHGSAAGIWQLAAAGERFLRARRADPDRRRFDQPGAAFISHTLAVADVAVALIEGARLGGYELLELQTEPSCWRKFSGSGATVLTLKPDLFVVTADAETETHSFVEVDRGTEHLPAVLRKCETYQRYARSGAEERTRGLFPAVVWLTTNDLRVGNMRRAIAESRTLDDDLFVITTADAHFEELAPYPTPTHPKGGTP